MDKLTFARVRDLGKTLRMTEDEARSAFEELVAIGVVERVAADIYRYLPENVPEDVLDIIGPAAVEEWRRRRGR